jgi:hypothetical protein
VSSLAIVLLEQCTDSSQLGADVEDPSEDSGDIRPLDDGLLRWVLVHPAIVAQCMPFLRGECREFVAIAPRLPWPEWPRQFG